ncbi:MAG: hypothetical protein BGO12_10250 [Verrucomicrobia bacterium 61-8]|nr:hypothetical protein [Verrucomicrobiota bacterium]OJV03058.1 MAG: hypothetical protein BGO12_10250 [Verrucomicrobia bacterium 61-8]
MRKLLTALALVLAVTPVFAGRLDIAVIQFGSERTPEELAAALSRTNLSEITNSDRTITSENELKAGNVLFAQSFVASPGAGFATSTRLGNQRADVKGQLGSGRVSVNIDIIEGVKLGLRNYATSNYNGSGPVSSAPQIISMKQTRIKGPQVEKGQTKMRTLYLTTILVAQYQP